MDPFIDYPVEMIIKICNELDTPSLLKTSEASSKVYQVCSDIIKDRKEKGYSQKIDKIVENILKGEYLNFVKEFPDIRTHIPLTSYIAILLSHFGNYVVIHQNLVGPTEYLEDIPWILPGIPFELKFNNRRSLVMDKSNIEIIKQLAKNLVDQEYKIKKIGLF